MTGALEGVRVVDFGQYIAGPLAAMLLADQGAEVVHVDPPGGPRMHSAANATWNRTKLNVELDLTRQQDREIAQRLVAGADVLIENFRPGVMDRLGFGAEAMATANPRLVYCSLPGFAADDPRAAVPAWEGVVTAAAGGYPPPHGSASDRPAYTAIPTASNFAAYIAATAITMALIARGQDGPGQRIEVPLFDAMFTAIGAHGLLVNGRPAGTGAGIGIGSGIYQCADGRWVQFNTQNPRFLAWFAEAAGVGRWRDEELLDRDRLAADPALSDELRRRLTALFQTRAALDWEDLINTAGAPLALCRTPAEWLETAHARLSGAVVAVDDPVFGSMLQPGSPVRLSRTPGAVHPRRAALPVDLPVWPGHGVVAPADGASAALAGVRVLDLTQVLAGPMAARTLAEFGADVIKINDPLDVAYFGVNVYRYHVDVNRGKRTMLLDLRTPAGLEVFWRLVDGADVVLQNFRHGVAERMGIGYEQVRARRPDVIYASVSAYGYEGPWRDRRGYEPQGQAVAGMQARFGGDGKPVSQAFPVNDYGTGMFGAYAVALALLHRQRHGAGQHVDVSLAYTATMHQSPFLNSYTGKVWDEPRGQEALGSGPLHRLYRAADRWLFLGGGRDDTSRLASVPSLDGAAGRDGDGLIVYLEERIATESAAVWVERLLGAGLGAHTLERVAEVMADPWVQAHGLSLTRDHPGIGPATTIGPAARLSRTPVTPGRPAPAPGADGSEVLREIGMGVAHAPAGRHRE